MRICTIIPFVSEVPPIWIPKDCILVEDGATHVTYLDRPERKNTTADIVNIRERHGFGENVDRAMELAWLRGYDLALIWNSDARPLLYEASDAQPDETNEEWLANLAAPFAQENIGAVAPVKPLPYEQRTTGNSVVQYYEPTTNGAQGQLADIGDSCAVHGMCYSPLYMVRIEAFLAIGGHDALFSGGFYEDADIWIRLRRYGLGTVINGNCLYEHGDKDGNPTQTYKKLYDDTIINGQAKRSLSLLLRKYNILPPLREPLRLSYLDWRLKARAQRIADEVADVEVAPSVYAAGVVPVPAGLSQVQLNWAAEDLNQLALELGGPSGGDRLAQQSDADKNSTWTYRDAHVVPCGDVLDQSQNATDGDVAVSAGPVQDGGAGWDGNGTPI